jgi:hypothetical protein
VEKLEAAFKKMSEDKSFLGLIQSLGDAVQFQGGKEFAETWRREWEQHAKLVEAAQK